MTILKTQRDVNVCRTHLSEPHILLDRTLGHYQVKTANTADELKSVFKLRYDVFYREFANITDSELSSPLDIEAYDSFCDHLIVKDLRNDEVVACYRLLSSENKPLKENFYSESEFVIDEFINNGHRKLELGRACVNKKYRRGTVVLLLWRGLIEYARLSHSRYLFGCSSISHDQFSFIPEILNEISLQDKFIQTWSVGVRENYQVDVTKLETKSDTALKAHTSLMQIYLNAGAEVGRNFAYDRAFNCIDLFTVLDLKVLPVAFQKGLID